jgi:hypothetical protein
MNRRGYAFIGVVLGILLITAAGWAAASGLRASDLPSTDGQSVACDQDAGPCVDAVPTAETTVGACKMSPQCWTNAD